MKVNPNDFPKDPCLTSMNLLKERIEKYFLINHKDSTTRYYPELDIYQNLNHFKDDTVIDIILFGNNLKSFFQSTFWPSKKFRLWTLSRDFKDFWDTKLLSSISKKINLIPREQLVKPTPSNTPSGEYNLIYGGRLSSQKNIGYLLNLYKELEKNNNVTLTLCGNYDDEFHENYGRREEDNYQVHIEELIDKLNFKNKPIIHHNLNHNEWLNLPLKNPIFITLSNYFCEDFGASLAQAQEAGWPIIVPAHLGFNDITHEQVLKIPPIFFPNAHNTDEIHKFLSRHMATFIETTSFEKVAPPVAEVTTPVMITSDQMAHAVNVQVQKFGPNIRHLLNEKTDLFYDLEVGLRFKFLLEDFLAEKYHVSEVLCVGEDFDHNIFSYDQLTKLDDLFKEPFKYRFSYLPLKYAFKSKSYTKKFFNASKVVLLTQKNDQIKNILINDFGVSENIIS